MHHALRVRVREPASDISPDPNHLVDGEPVIRRLGQQVR